MDQIAQIREKIDLVSLISEHVTLKKAGKNFKALCPFHGEKSPSFIVSPEREMWHCFGCGKGGDCYTFLMEYDHMEFPEALRILAKRAGIELAQGRYDRDTASKKEKIYKLNALAAEYYHFVLFKHHAGKQALAYLTGRKINERVLKTFQLGFAPGIGNALVSYLEQRKHYTREEILEAGLGILNGRGFVDFFRRRIIFPLYDHRDNVIGFSGRVLDTSQTAKYINSRDTLVYHKRDHVFGLNITKEAIKKQNQVILVEGEFDVLSCFQAGISNVVAVKGTALTDSQAGLLSRYAQKVTICFDGDKSGQEAIKRSLPVLEKKGLTTTVVVIPDGKDPDEALKKNAFSFQQATKNDSSVYDYLLATSLAGSDPTTVEGKRAISAELLPVYGQITNEIVKEHFLRKVSTALDTSYESIVKELGRVSKPEPTATVTILTKARRTREEVLEEYLTALILQGKSPQRSFEKATGIMTGAVAGARAYQKILTYLPHYFAKHTAFDARQFGALLPVELSDAYTRASLLPLPVFETPVQQIQEVERVAKELKHIFLRQRMKQLADAIKAKEQEGSEEQAENLRAEYAKLSVLLKN